MTRLTKLARITTLTGQKTDKFLQASAAEDRTARRQRAYSPILHLEEWLNADELCFVDVYINSTEATFHFVYLSDSREDLRYAYKPSPLSLLKRINTRWAS